LKEVSLWQRSCERNGGIAADDQKNCFWNNARKEGYYFWGLKVKEAGTHLITPLESGQSDPTKRAELWENAGYESPANGLIGVPNLGWNQSLSKSGSAENMEGEGSCLTTCDGCKNLSYLQNDGGGGV